MLLASAMQLRTSGAPKQLERAMLTARRPGVAPTGINSAGQRQLIPVCILATAARWRPVACGDGPRHRSRTFCVSPGAATCALQRRFPKRASLVLETADGFLAHYHADGSGRPTMHPQRQLQDQRGTCRSNRMTFLVRSVGGVSLDRRQEIPRSFSQGDPLGSLRQVNFRDVVGHAQCPRHMGQGPTQIRSGQGWIDTTHYSTAAETTKSTRLAYVVTGDTSYLNKVYAAFAD